MVSLFILLSWPLASLHVAAEHSCTEANRSASGALLQKHRLSSSQLSLSQVEEEKHRRSEDNFRIQAEAMQYFPGDVNMLCRVTLCKHHNYQHCFETFETRKEVVYQVRSMREEATSLWIGDGCQKLVLKNEDGDTQTFDADSSAHLEVFDDLRGTDHNDDLSEIEITPKLNNARECNSQGCKVDLYQYFNYQGAKLTLTSKSVVSPEIYYFRLKGGCPQNFDGKAAPFHDMGSTPAIPRCRVNQLLDGSSITVKIHDYDAAHMNDYMITRRSQNLPDDFDEDFKRIDLFADACGYPLTARCPTGYTAAAGRGTIMWHHDSVARQGQKEAYAACSADPNCCGVAQSSISSNVDDYTDFAFKELYRSGLEHACKGQYPNFYDCNGLYLGWINKDLDANLNPKLFLVDCAITDAVNTEHKYWATCRKVSKGPELCWRQAEQSEQSIVNSVAGGNRSSAAAFMAEVLDTAAGLSSGSTSRERAGTRRRYTGTSPPWYTPNLQSMLADFAGLQLTTMDLMGFLLKQSSKEISQLALHGVAETFQGTEWGKKLRKALREDNCKQALLVKLNKRRYQDLPNFATGDCVSHGRYDSYVAWFKNLKQEMKEDLIKYGMLSYGETLKLDAQDRGDAYTVATDCFKNKAAIKQEQSKLMLHFDKLYTNDPLLKKTLYETVIKDSPEEMCEWRAFQKKHLDTQQSILDRFKDLASLLYDGVALLIGLKTHEQLSALSEEVHQDLVLLLKFMRDLSYDKERESWPTVDVRHLDPTSTIAGTYMTTSKTLEKIIAEIDGLSTELMSQSTALSAITGLSREQLFGSIENFENLPGRFANLKCDIDCDDGFFCSDSLFSWTLQKSCKAVSSCVFGSTYQSRAPTKGSDRECSDVSDCILYQTYETLAPTLTSDRECSDVSECILGKTYQRSAPTLTSDRECSDVSECILGKTYQRSAPTLTSDRECADVSECIVGKTYQYWKPYTSSDGTIQDRICKPVSQCSEGELETVPPSLERDRSCAVCQNGVTRRRGGASSCTVCPDSLRGTKTVDVDCEHAPNLLTIPTTMTTTKYIADDVMWLYLMPGSPSLGEGFFGFDTGSLPTSTTCPYGATKVDTLWNRMQKVLDFGTNVQNFDLGRYLVCKGGDFLGKEAYFFQPIGNHFETGEGCPAGSSLLFPFYVYDNEDRSWWPTNLICRGRMEGNVGYIYMDTFPLDAPRTEITVMPPINYLGKVMNVYGMDVTALEDKFKERRFGFLFKEGLGQEGCRASSMSSKQLRGVYYVTRDLQGQEPTMATMCTYQCLRQPECHAYEHGTQGMQIEFCKLWSSYPWPFFKKPEPNVIGGLWLWNDAPAHSLTGADACYVKIGDIPPPPLEPPEEPQAPPPPEKSAPPEEPHAPPPPEESAPPEEPQAPPPPEESVPPEEPHTPSPPEELAPPEEPHAPPPPEESAPPEEPQAPPPPEESVPPEEPHAPTAAPAPHARRRKTKKTNNGEKQTTRKRRRRRRRQRKTAKKARKNRRRGIQLLHAFDASRFHLMNSASGFVVQETRSGVHALSKHGLGPWESWLFHDMTRQNASEWQDVRLISYAGHYLEDSDGIVATSASDGESTSWKFIKVAASLPEEEFSICNVHSKRCLECDEAGRLKLVTDTRPPEVMAVQADPVQRWKLSPMRKIDFEAESFGVPPPPVLGEKVSLLSPHGLHLHEHEGRLHLSSTPGLWLRQESLHELQEGLIRFRAPSGRYLAAHGGHPGVDMGGNRAGLWQLQAARRDREGGVYLVSALSGKRLFATQNAVKLSHHFVHNQSWQLVPASNSLLQLDADLGSAADEGTHEFDSDNIDLVKAAAYLEIQGRDEALYCEGMQRCRCLLNLGIRPEASPTYWQEDAVAGELQSIHTLPVDLGISDASFTISAWIHRTKDSRDDTEQAILGTEKPDTDRGGVLSLGIKSGKLFMSFGPSVCLTDQVVSKETWHSVAFVYDKSRKEQTIYLNRQEVKRCIDKPSFSGLAGLAIGGTAKRLFSGMVKELSVYNSAMQSSQLPLLSATFSVRKAYVPQEIGRDSIWGSFTVTAWITPTEDDAVLGSTRWILGTDDGNLLVFLENFELAVSLGRDVCKANASLQVGLKQHVAVVLDTSKAKLRIYVDGKAGGLSKECDVAAEAAQSLSTSSTWKLGPQPPSDSNTMSGSAGCSVGYPVFIVSKTRSWALSTQKTGGWKQVEGMPAEFRTVLRNARGISELLALTADGDGHRIVSYTNRSKILRGQVGFGSTHDAIFRSMDLEAQEIQALGYFHSYAQRWRITDAGDGYFFIGLCDDSHCTKSDWKLSYQNEFVRVGGSEQSMAEYLSKQSSDNEKWQILFETGEPACLGEKATFQGDVEEFKVYPFTLAEEDIFKLSGRVACPFDVERVADTSEYLEFDNFCVLDDGSDARANQGAGHSSKSLEECKVSCKSESTCTGIEWYAARHTCFLTTSSIAGGSRGPQRADAKCYVSLVTEALPSLLSSLSSDSDSSQAPDGGLQDDFHGLISEQIQTLRNLASAKVSPRRGASYGMLANHLDSCFSGGSCNAALVTKGVASIGLDVSKETIKVSKAVKIYKAVDNFRPLMWADLNAKVLSMDSPTLFFDVSVTHGGMTYDVRSGLQGSQKAVLRHGPRNKVQVRIKNINNKYVWVDVCETCLTFETVKAKMGKPVKSGAKRLIKGVVKAAKSAATRTVNFGKTVAATIGEIGAKKSMQTLMIGVTVYGVVSDIMGMVAAFREGNIPLGVMSMISAIGGAITLVASVVKLAIAAGLMATTTFGAIGLIVGTVIGLAAALGALIVTILQAPPDNDELGEQFCCLAAAYGTEPGVFKNFERMQMLYNGGPLAQTLNSPPVTSLDLKASFCHGIADLIQQAD
eukprot:TRINITY_DN4141_c0_g1_i4.p1 TRINITY_DN4141_c0_g1~~TRINITY_DN4141_c0_g1_i4.p1  ORF type:complete len:2869 (-),score=414.31 TRINITY_DN4141_c0_g1_i4:40-8646(-)